MLYLQIVQNIMGSTMNYKTLLEKYKSLLDEVIRLTKENDQLKAIVFQAWTAPRILFPRSVCLCCFSEVAKMCMQSGGRIKRKEHRVIRLFA